MSTKNLSFSTRAFTAFGTIIAASLLLSVVMPLLAKAATPITGQMGVGSRGANVSNLQAFLASNPDIYPSGLVTGYFGSLTRAAVGQFQAHYGIDQVGRVGPQTMAQINGIINSGVGLDLRAPIIFTFNVASIGNNSATINWTTDTAATGRVYYSTAPMQMTEATRGRQAPIINGTIATATTTGTSQSVTLSGLAPNTIYYYVIMATDTAGNVSVTTQQTLRTNQ